jgi:hypothetical protein
MQLDISNNTTDGNISAIIITDNEKAGFYDFVHGLYLYAIPLIAIFAFSLSVIIIAEMFPSVVLLDISNCITCIVYTASP